MTIILVVAIAMMSVGHQPVANIHETTSAGLLASSPEGNQGLTPRQQQQLQAMIDRHERIRARLQAADRADLDKLTTHVRDRLFVSPLHGSLLSSTTQIIRRAIPRLSTSEAAALAGYVLGGIATEVNTGTQPQRLAALQTTDFTLQYVQLQPRMLNESRSYTAISNILKTKHDVVKNSISNIR